MQNLITHNLLQQGMDFESYHLLTIDIVEGRITPDKYKEEKMLRYTRSNLERMDKVLSRMKLSQKLYNALNAVVTPWTWVLITEPWCGDASWTTAELHLIAESSDKIDLKIFLRDTHPQLIAHYHTNGSHSIPKLICLNSSDLNEVWTWGSRPAALQSSIEKWHTDVMFDFRDTVRKVHAWYEEDMGCALQEEILAFIKPII